MMDPEKFEGSLSDRNIAQMFYPRMEVRSSSHLHYRPTRLWVDYYLMSTMKTDTKDPYLNFHYSRMVF